MMAVYELQSAIIGEQTGRSINKNQLWFPSIYTHTHLVWTSTEVQFLRPTQSPGAHGKSPACQAPQRHPFSCPHAWPVQGQRSALCPSPSEWPEVTVRAWGQIKMPASNFAPTGLSFHICPKICPLLTTQKSTTTSTHDWVLQKYTLSAL